MSLFKPDTVAEQIKAIFAEVLECPPALIPEDLWLTGDGVDSLDLLEIAGDIERRFQIKIEDQDLHALRTVADLIRFVETLVAEKPTP